MCVLRCPFQSSPNRPSSCCLVGSRSVGSNLLNSLYSSSDNILGTVTWLQLLSRSSANEKIISTCPRLFGHLSRQMQGLGRANPAPSEPHSDGQSHLKHVKVGGKETNWHCAHAAHLGSKWRREKKMYAALQVCALTGCVSGGEFQTPAA